MTSKRPRPDKYEIHRALSTILLPGQVTELRAIRATEPGWRSPHIISGYFNNIEAMVRAADSISAKGIYFIPNKIHPALLARALNRVRGLSRGDPTTSDNKIIRRLWFLIDADPVRPDSYISATNSEHQLALKRSDTIRGALRKEGWPEPIMGDSGNGGHLLYAIDLPPDDDGLVQRSLAALAARFDDELVTIDQKVYNPARIWKLYGTVARKGDHTPDRPHRLSRLLDVPKKIELVPPELLEKLASIVPNESLALPSPNRFAASSQSHHAAGGYLTPHFNVDAWLKKYSCAVRKKGPWRTGGYRWELELCPFNPDHTDGSAFVIQHPNGAIGAGCHHNSCTWGWKEMRALFEAQSQSQPPTRKKTALEVIGLLITLVEACSQLEPSEQQKIKRLMAQLVKE